ncbi:ABC transporter A family member 10 [Acorus calamus]|uniref:ABC transporter A family member 10 n=1 Tax=Acorus calamus TaxID=4465 RepID=A0AAV9EEH2_ACOCL|nr:ABC transporter A family member 10 [Acorus calamus]
MDVSNHGRASFRTQADALLRKNIAIQYSTLDQAVSCPISNPPAWPPLLQVPRPEDRATRTEYSSFMELPDESCKLTQSCPATIMFTGDNQSLAEKVTCLQGLLLWLNSSSEINDQLFKGYRQGNTERKSNEIIAAYDFLNSNENNLNVIIWYNSTHNNKIGNGPPALVRVPRSLNVASNAYLEFLRGSGVKIQFDFVKEMPKSATQIKLDFSSLLGALFFTWVVELLFPV